MYMIKDAVKLKYTDDALYYYVKDLCNVTVRYEDEKCISAGDIIMMQTTDEEVVGSAYVDFVAECRARDVLVLIDVIQGKYPVKDEEELLENMNVFYDDVTEHDFLKVIRKGHIRLEDKLEVILGLKNEA